MPLEALPEAKLLVVGCSRARWLSAEQKLRTAQNLYAECILNALED